MEENRREIRTKIDSVFQRYQSRIDKYDQHFKTTY